MRRRKAKKIAILPDPKFNDTQVTKFVNNLMFSGKKNLAFKIFYEAIEIVDGKVEDATGLETWKKCSEPPDSTRLTSTCNVFDILRLWL